MPKDPVLKKEFKLFHEFAKSRWGIPAVIAVVALGILILVVTW